MALDLVKLTSAPWIVKDSRVDVEFFTDADGDVNHGAQIISVVNGDDFPLCVISVDFNIGRFKEEPEDLKFIALARNAMDVMQRRGWYAVPLLKDQGWFVRGDALTKAGYHNPESRIAADPFTSLVEADNWYRIVVEGGQSEQDWINSCR